MSEKMQVKIGNERPGWKGQAAFAECLPTFDVKE